MDVLLSCWARHPSRLQDNMMPMSPDDYKALSQYVSPRDIDAVVSHATSAALNMTPPLMWDPGGQVYV